MIVLALILLIGGLVLLGIASRQEAIHGLPRGRLIYADTAAWKPAPEPFFDRDLGLTGKPDYLFSKRSSFIPVEVKSSHHAHLPYEAHIFQLAAYMLLVERKFDAKPPFGILHYELSKPAQSGGRSGNSYAIRFTGGLRRQTLDLLADMHALEGQNDIPRSHDNPARCRKCGYRQLCDQRLD
jgi:CRISPR-associated exonuclease Cas4